MQNEKRNIRTYKVADSAYKKAMKVAGKRKIHLSNVMELVAIAMSHDMDIRVIRKNDNGSFSALDVFDEKTSKDISK